MGEGVVQMLSWEGRKGDVPGASIRLDTGALAERPDAEIVMQKLWPTAPWGAGGSRGVSQYSAVTDSRGAGPTSSGRRARTIALESAIRILGDWTCTRTRGRGPTKRELWAVVPG